MQKYSNLCLWLLAAYFLPSFTTVQWAPSLDTTSAVHSEATTTMPFSQYVEMEKKSPDAAKSNAKLQQIMDEYPSVRGAFDKYEQASTGLVIALTGTNDPQVIFDKNTHIASFQKNPPVQIGVSTKAYTDFAEKHRRDPQKLVSMLAYFTKQINTLSTLASNPQTRQQTLQLLSRQSITYNTHPPATLEEEDRTFHQIAEQEGLQGDFPDKLEQSIPNFPEGGTNQKTPPINEIPFN